MGEVMSPAERFQDAYRHMAAIGYRPAAPSDGMGTITVPLEQLDLDDEARRYARRFIAEEHTRTFWLGVTDYTTNRAFAWTVEAARLMCAGPMVRGDLVPRLLRLALADYRRASSRREPW